jgi:hypothetical protein
MAQEARIPTSLAFPPPPLEDASAAILVALKPARFGVSIKPVARMVRGCRVIAGFFPAECRLKAG